MVRIGIVNVTGYMGAEAARLLHAHPEVELTSVTGRSAAGKPLGEVFPHLAPSASPWRRSWARSTLSSRRCLTPQALRRSYPTLSAACRWST